MNQDVFLTLPYHVREEWIRQRELNRILARALELACDEFGHGPISREGWYIRLISQAQIEVRDAIDKPLSEDAIERMAELLVNGVIQ